MMMTTYDDGDCDGNDDNDIKYDTHGGELIS